jgi:hypothetical protein
MTVELDGRLALHTSVNGSWWILDQEKIHTLLYVFVVIAIVIVLVTLVRGRRW